MLLYDMEIRSYINWIYNSVSEKSPNLSKVEPLLQEIKEELCNSQIYHRFGKKYLSNYPEEIGFTSIFNYLFGHPGAVIRKLSDKDRDRFINHLYDINNFSSKEHTSLLKCYLKAYVCELAPLDRLHYVLSASINFEKNSKSPENTKLNNTYSNIHGQLKIWLINNACKGMEKLHMKLNQTYSRLEWMKYLSQKCDFASLLMYTIKYNAESRISDCKVHIPSVQSIGIGEDGLTYEEKKHNLKHFLNSLAQLMDKEQECDGERLVPIYSDDLMKLTAVSWDTNIQECAVALTVITALVFHYTSGLCLQNLETILQTPNTQTSKNFDISPPYTDTNDQLENDIKPKNKFFLDLKNNTSEQKKVDKIFLKIGNERVNGDVVARKDDTSADDDSSSEVFLTPTEEITVEFNSIPKTATNLLPKCSNKDITLASDKPLPVLSLKEQFQKKKQQNKDLNNNDDSSCKMPVMMQQKNVKSENETTWLDQKSKGSVQLSSPLKRLTAQVGKNSPRLATPTNPTFDTLFAVESVDGKDKQKVKLDLSAKRHQIEKNHLEQDERKNKVREDQLRAAFFSVQYSNKRNSDVSNESKSIRNGDGKVRFLEESTKIGSDNRNNNVDVNDDLKMGKVEDKFSVKGSDNNVIREGSDKERNNNQTINIDCINVAEEKDNLQIQVEVESDRSLNDYVNKQELSKIDVIDQKLESTLNIEGDTDKVVELNENLIVDKEIIQESDDVLPTNGDVHIDNESIHIPCQLANEQSDKNNDVKKNNSTENKLTILSKDADINMLIEEDLTDDKDELEIPQPIKEYEERVLSPQPSSVDVALLDNVDEYQPEENSEMKLSSSLSNSSDGTVDDSSSTRRKRIDLLNQELFKVSQQMEISNVESQMAVTPTSKNVSLTEVSDIPANTTPVKSSADELKIDLSVDIKDENDNDVQSELSQSMNTESYLQSSSEDEENFSVSSSFDAEITKSLPINPIAFTIEEDDPEKEEARRLKAERLMKREQQRLEQLERNRLKREEQKEKKQMKLIETEMQKEEKKRLEKERRDSLLLKYLENKEDIRDRRFSSTPHHTPSKTLSKNGSLADTRNSPLSRVKRQQKTVTDQSSPLKNNLNSTFRRPNRVVSASTSRLNSTVNDSSNTMPNSEYSGPKLYKMPKGKSNRSVMINAISYCCLAGSVNEQLKITVLKALSNAEGSHFMILFRDTRCQYRALYNFNLTAETLTLICGTGPKTINHDMVEKFYKYSSGAKQFKLIGSTKHLSPAIDGVCILDHLWSNKSNLALAGAISTSRLLRN